MHRDSGGIIPPVSLTPISRIGPFHQPSLQQLSHFFRNQTSSTERWKDIQSKTSNWWKKAIEGRRGLLLILIPIISTQFHILQSAFPFCIDRFLQYSHPINLFLLATISSNRGISIMKYALIVGTLLGMFKMLQDTYLYGPNLLPILPQTDSYALITGASSGLGKELAKKLYQEGYNLVLVSSNQTKLAITKEEILDQPTRFSTQRQFNDAMRISSEPQFSLQQSGDKIIIEEKTIDSESSSTRKDIQLISCNLENPFSSFFILKELKKKGIETKIDILICNAGKCHYGPVETSSFLNMKQVIDVNVASTLGLVRFIVPRMIERKRRKNSAGGRIVIVSSINSASSPANIACYSASKAFLTSFSHSLRKELFPKGILVTLALPGPISDTNFLQSTQGLHYPPTKSKIPGINTSARFNSERIFEALRLGHETVIPGITNQFFYHILSKILPRSILSDIVELGWKPLPSFRRKQHLQQHPKSSQRPIAKKSVKQRLIDFWNQPVIDYQAISQWMKFKWQRLTKPDQHHEQSQSRQERSLAGDEEQGIVEEEERGDTGPDQFDELEKEEEKTFETYFAETMKEGERELRIRPPFKKSNRRELDDEDIQDEGSKSFSDSNSDSETGTETNEHDEARQPRKEELEEQRENRLPIDDFDRVDVEEDDNSEDRQGLNQEEENEQPRKKIIERFLPFPHYS